MKKVASNFDFVVIGGWIWFALSAGILLVVASRCQVNLFDTYDLFVNAKCIAFRDPSQYGWTRFMFLPTLLAPVSWLTNVFHFGPAAFERSTHFFAVMSWAGFLWSGYTFFRLEWDPRRAFFVTVLMSFNPLLIHYAPTFKEDIPGAFFAALTFSNYLKFRIEGNIRSFGWCLAALCAAVLTRYNLLLSIPVVIVLFEGVTLLTKKSDCRPFPNRFFIAGIAIFSILLILLPLGLYLYLGRSFPGCELGCRVGADWIAARGAGGSWLLSWWPVVASSKVFCSLMNWASDFLAMCGYNKTFVKYGNPFWCLEFIFISSVGIAMILAVVGLVVGLKAWRPTVRLAVIWLTVFFIFQAFLVWFKEARYLLPLFPAYYFFVGIGFFALESFFKQKSKSGALRFGFVGRFVLPIAVLVLLGMAVRELVRFRDPFYYDAFPERLSRQAGKYVVGTENRLFWIGPLYTRHAREYVFSKNDLNTYLYHLGGNVIAFYTGRKVFWRNSIPWSDLRQGDVLVKHREPETYITRTVPKTMGPIEVVQVQRADFVSNSTVAGDLSQYRSKDWPEAVVKVTMAENRLNLNGEGFRFPAGEFRVECSFDMDGKKSVSQKMDFRDGRFHWILAGGVASLPQRIVVTGLEHKEYVQ